MREALGSCCRDVRDTHHKGDTAKLMDHLDLDDGPRPQVPHVAAAAPPRMTRARTRSGGGQLAQCGLRESQKRDAARFGSPHAQARLISEAVAHAYTQLSRRLSRGALA